MTELPMRWFLAQMAFTVAACVGQPLSAADAPSVRNLTLAAGQWVAEPLSRWHLQPESGGEPERPILAAGPGEVRTHLVGDVLAAGVSLSADVEWPRGGAWVVALGADRARTQGFELAMEAPGGWAILRRLTPFGPEEMGRCSLPAGLPGSVSLRWSVSGIDLRFGDQRVRPRGGWAPCRGIRPGRVHLGAEGGVVRLSGARISLRLPPATWRRVREVRESSDVLPDLRPIPMVGLSGRWGLDGFLADLPPEGHGALEDAWRALQGGREAEARRGLLPLRASYPDHIGVAVLLARAHAAAGAQGGALEVLPEITDDPELAALRGDALLALGRLDAAAEAFTAGHSAAGRSLVEWARGNRNRGPAEGAAPDGVKTGDRGAAGSQEEGERWRTVENLELLHQLSSWGRGRRGRVTVLSDFHDERAEAVARDADHFLTGVSGWLGGAFEPRPVTVLVCSDPETFARWNDRLGGASHVDSLGIYRPGTGLLVVLDDDDPDAFRPLLHHELVHHAVWERGFDLPRVFEEGLAEVLGHARATETTLVDFHRVAPARCRRAWEWASAHRLANPADFLLAEEIPDGVLGRATYGQAWAALHAVANGPGGPDSLRDLIQHVANRFRSHPADVAATLTRLVSADSIREHLEALKGR